MRLNLTREQRVADRYLRTYSVLCDNIESACDHIARAVSMREPVAHAGEIVGGGVNRDKMLVAVASLDEGVDAVRDGVEALADKFDEVAGFINDVQASDYEAGHVLRLAYIGGLSADQIAERDEVGCSRKTVYERMKRGLDLAFAILSEG